MRPPLSIAADRPSPTSCGQPWFESVSGGAAGESRPRDRRIGGTPTYSGVKRALAPTPRLTAIADELQLQTPQLTAIASELQIEGADLRR